MLNKETLSKQKYIYYVHKSDGYETHIERFPIVYINSKYVYFKRAGQDQLGCRFISEVKDSLTDIFNIDYQFIYEHNRYFWNPEENPNEVVAELKKKADEKRIKQNKSWAEKELERAKQAYERAQEKYNLWKELESKKGATS